MKPKGSLPHSQKLSTCPYPKSDPSSPYSHPTSWRSILILPSHRCLGLPSGLLPSDLPIKSLYPPLLFPTVPHALLNPFPLLTSCQRVSPSPRSYEMFRNIDKFLRWGAVRTSPNPHPWSPPSVGCPRLLIQYIRRWSPYLEAVSPSATWRSAIPWWQCTYLQLILTNQKLALLDICDSYGSMRRTDTSAALISSPNYSPERRVYKFTVLLNTFTIHGSPRSATCEEFKVRTVHRGQQHVRNSRSVQYTEASNVRNSKSVQYTEASNMWGIQSPYSTPRPATCEEFKVRTVHLGQQHVRNSRSVQYAEASIEVLTT